MPLFYEQAAVYHYVGKGKKRNANNIRKNKRNIMLRMNSFARGNADGIERRREEEEEKVELFPYERERSLNAEAFYRKLLRRNV